ncbi:AAA family ATPase [Cellvibrio fibrivorans]|uniref:DamX protein n=1 Tax=Cellvibrio fibrivorans TaxID=126350 RepID=A0ABU1USM9_9GAMM|nr:AAA family ATPase [Cellvibrio fibrivorans]MDR7088178.1 DamX protein [Cellvibrio fibrivorans]
MTRESPLRAQPDSRLLDHGDSQQGYLFDEPDDEHPEDQLLADYRQRYGLSEDPFAHDYSFPLFTGAGRRQLLDQLLHLCQFSNSVLAVLGEHGLGKTRIAHAFMDSLSDQDQICFLSLRSGQSLEQILLSIIQSFGIETSDVPSTESLLATLEAFIAEEAVSDDDGLAVVVLDNAQLLDDQSISVLTSLLSNFPQQNRLHLALFGEPQLMHRLERLSPENLLINDFHLQPFGLLETVDYLNFRMEMADYLGPEIFTEPMVEPWWRQTHGQLSVLHELAQERLLESVTPPSPSSKRPLPVVHIIAISMLIAVVGVAFLYMGDDKTQAPTNSSLANSTALPTAAPQPETTQPASVASAGVDNKNAELSSTDTPVQPLLQTLPQPLQPNQQVQPITEPLQTVESAASTSVISEDMPKEEVVPLAQLPTSQPKPTQALPEPMPIAQAKPVEVAPQPAAPPEVKVIKPEPDIVKPTVKSVSTAAIGAGAQERNILSWRPSEYTIQLLGVSSEKAARDFVAAQANKKDLLVFKSKRQGKDWFVVITGRYISSAQARQAIARLPDVQRDAGPWPRDVKTIQNEIKSAL